LGAREASAKEEVGRVEPEVIAKKIANPPREEGKEEK
jgi:hypothetical protein